MITTNDPKLYQKLLLLRSHGITKDPKLLLENHGGWYYEMQELGFNYRLTDFQAALGLSQLKRADLGLRRRRTIAGRYDDAFRGSSVCPLPPQPQGGHAYHLYVIRVAQRRALYDYLKAESIFAQVHYIPVHLLPYYRERGHHKGEFPVAEAYYEECLSIPMYPALDDSQVEYVSSTIKAFYKEI